MKKTWDIVYQILKNLATQSIRNFGHLLTLIVGMRNVGYDNKGPGNGRGFRLPPYSKDIDPGSDIIQPVEIMQILKENGTIVTLDEARMILEFMCKLANISLDIYLKT
jgi:hypothetical protein